MSLKRSYEDAVRDEAASSSRDPTRTRPEGPLSPKHTTTSSTAQGKQRRLSFTDDDGDCASASTSSRPRVSTARFIAGLQTHVGGLQMSHDSCLPRSPDPPARPSPDTAARRSLDAPDAMQPLMMSRNADSDRRASQSTARRRSQEALEDLARRASLVEPEAQPVPDVSPGWHVEAQGSQAMTLQEGIRSQDEEGWTPLEAFPASTRQGKLAVKRAKLRRKQQQLHHQSQRRPQWDSQVDPDLDLLAQFPRTSVSAPAITVDPAPPKQSLPTAPDARPATSALVDIEMIEDIVDTLSVPLVGTHAHIAQPASASPFTSPLSSSVSSWSAPTTSLLSTNQDRSRGDPSKGSFPKVSHALSDFEVVETLGTGTFGRVLLVRLRHRDAADRSAYFALKVLAKTDVVKLKQVSHINSERSILTKVDHPFLVNMVASFQDSKNCYMLMEYVVGGEIFSYLRRVGQFSPDVARFYISTIVLAIEYLHNNNVVYRDLKPENLLIDSNGYTKITDFGFAKEVEDRTWTLCGTPEYLAPEIIQCTGHGTAVDWWSLGILLYEMLVGYPPFYDPNPILIYEKILAGNLVFPEEIDSVSRDLISSLLTIDRSKRLGNLHGGANDIKNHPWFHGVDWRALQAGKIPPPIVPFLGSPGDTSNFSKYEPARPSAMPGLFGTDQEHLDLHADLFPDF